MNAKIAKAQIDYARRETGCKLGALKDEALGLGVPASALARTLEYDKTRNSVTRLPVAYVMALILSDKDLPMYPQGGHERSTKAGANRSIPNP